MYEKRGIKKSCWLNFATETRSNTELKRFLLLIVEKKYAKHNRNHCRFCRGITE